MSETQILIYMLAGFGSITTGLLGLILVGVQRWMKRVEVIQDNTQRELSDVKLTVGQHKVEIKNIHHRLNEL